MGRAINKTVTIAEIIKRRVVGIHQTTDVDSSKIVDSWEPTEEGLNKIETHRTVSSITITLSLKPLDSKHLGYQKPLPEEEVKFGNDEKKEERKKETKNDDNKEKKNFRKDGEKGNREGGSGRYRGRGRGRGRGGFRGRGRGRGRGTRRRTYGQKDQTQSQTQTQTQQK